MRSFFEVIEKLLGELQRERLARAHPDLEVVEQLFSVLLQRQIHQERPQKCRNKNQSLDLILLKDIHELARIFCDFLRYNHQRHAVQQRTPDLADRVDKGQGRLEDSVNLRRRIRKFLPLPFQTILNDAVSQANTFWNARRARRVQNQAQVGDAFGQRRLLLNVCVAEFLRVAFEFVKLEGGEIRSEDVRSVEVVVVNNLSGI